MTSHDDKVNAQYQICVRCVMDTSDPDIRFDEHGVCSHCHYFDEFVQPLWHPDESGRRQLEQIVETIKTERAGFEYDCIIGLSGGIDSSYLAYLVRELGLRPLVVHIDTGWNSELAVQNIEAIVKKLGYDLYTHVVDWEEMRALQLAFFRAGVANQDTPQDHAIFAGLYRFAVQNKIRYVFSGSNYATESILPNSWGYSAMDARHIKGIYKRHGEGKKLKTFPFVSFFQYHFYYPYWKRMTVVRPLNFLPYNKELAISTLESELGWKYYGGKHYESRFTKFFQGYYLPVRFGYDKRRAHMASLIHAGQCTREEALEALAEPSYKPDEIEEDIEYIIKKLRITRQVWDEEIMGAPLRTHLDYPSSERRIQRFRAIKHRLKRVRPTKHIANDNQAHD